jgi:hypothetical protein
MSYIKLSDGSYAGVGSSLGIAGDIVDDSKEFTILVTGVTPPPLNCGDYYTESECGAAGCYWYNGTCHSTPEDVTPPTEIPWVTIIAAIGGAVILMGIVLAIRRR